MYLKKRKPQKTYLKFCGKAKENCRKNLSVKLASFLKKRELKETCYNASKIIAELSKLWQTIFWRRSFKKTSDFMQWRQ